MALTLGRGTTVHADSMPEQEGSTRCGRDSEMIKATGAEVTCKTCLKALAKDEAQDIDRIADEILTDRAGTWAPTKPVRYVEQPELMDRIRKLAARSAGTPGYASEPRRFRAGPAGKRGTHGRRHR